MTLRYPRITGVDPDVYGSGTCQYRSVNTTETQPTPRIQRRDGGRVIGGVAGGIADHLGVDAFRVRIVFVVLMALAGAGAAAYALLWFFCPPGKDTAPPARAERRQALGLAMLGFIAMAVVGTTTSGTPASALVPLVFVVVGASLVWREFDTSRAAQKRPMLTWTRMVCGVVFVIVGLVVVVIAGNRNFGGLSTTILAVAATLVGVVLLTVPLWMRLGRALNEERAARIRNAEREEIASHLHDSVLQTLALIQKQASSPEEVARLARGQERELRSWLFGDSAQHNSSLAAALRSVGAEVEDHYGLEVEIVAVGDLSPEEETTHEARRRWSALVGATREALINAAKHSGEKQVAVYCEVGDDEVEVFVRDRGVGFDPDLVAADRQGVSRSIRARMERAGGQVTIHTQPERGTNVELRMPRGSEEQVRAGSAPDQQEAQVDSEATAQTAAGDNDRDKGSVARNGSAIRSTQRPDEKVR